MGAGEVTPGLFPAGSAPPTSTKRILPGYRMADLILEDLRKQFREKLAQVLFHERARMFGEPELHPKKEECGSGPRAVAGSKGRSEKGGESHV